MVYVRMRRQCVRLKFTDNIVKKYLLLSQLTLLHVFLTDSGGLRRARCPIQRGDSLFIYLRELE